ncbi:MAG: hypothetical protein MHM6MM_001273 [Cercozoa sp. M6MM]
MNIIVGSGIIGLPFVLHQMGLGLGMCMLVFVAVVCDYTSQLLVRSALRVGKRDFEELAEHLWNRSGFYAASVFPLIVNFGALCAYTVILTDTLPVVVKAVLPDDVPAIVTSEWFIPLCALVVVVGPLCTLRDLSALSAVSFMSTLSMCCIVIGVIVRGAAVSNGFKFDPERIVNNEFPPYEFARSDVGTIVQGFGTISFAFAIHDTTFCVFRTLKTQTTSQWRKVSLLSYAVSASLSGAFAAAGYLSFYGDTQSNILEAFDVDDHVINFTRLMMAIAMLLTWPVVLFIARHFALAILARTFGTQALTVDTEEDVESLIENEEDADSLTRRAKPTVFYGLTALIFAAAACVGLTVGDLGVVLEVTGSIGASGVGYLIPCLANWTVFGSGMQRVRESTSLLGKFLALLRAAVPVVVFTFGVSSLVVGTSLSIMDAVN